jgi:hypothetical protein
MSDALPSIEQVIETMKSEKAAATPAPAVPTPPAVEAAAPAVETPAEEVPAVAEKVEESTPEVVAEEKPAEQPRDPISKKFAALSRQERELRQRKQEADRREAELANRIKALEEQQSGKKEKLSPYKLLREHGYNMQDAVNDSIGQFEEPKADPVEQRFSSIAEELAAVKRQLAEKTQQDNDKEYQQAIRVVEDTIEDTVKANPDKYELTAQFGKEAVDLVKEVMREYFTEHQKLLDYSEACDIVEKHYEEEVMSRLVSTKKVQSRFAASNTESSKPAPSKQESPKAASKAPNTLSHQSTTVSQAKVDVDKLDRDDALSLLAKQLKYV